MSYDPNKRRGRVVGCPGLWWRMRAIGTVVYELKVSRDGVQTSELACGEDGFPIENAEAAVERYRQLKQGGIGGRLPQLGQPWTALDQIGVSFEKLIEELGPDEALAATKRRLERLYEKALK